MRMFPLIVLLATPTFAACFDITAEVESNTEWSGAFGNRSVDGSGNQVVDLPEVDTIQCVVVQKSTEGGSLRVRIKVSGGLGISGPSGSEWVSTTAAFGVVTACTGE
jgi:hypothetical protein